MRSDSDLGPATLPVRDQVLHSSPTVTSPSPRPGPSRLTAGPTSGKFLTSHVPPCGHVTLIHDTLAAKNQNEQIKDSMLVYLNSFCTCLAVLGATDATAAMDHCDKRSIGNLSVFICIVQIRYPTLGMPKGGKGEEGEGAGGPANRTCGYIRSVHEHQEATNRRL
jgi:hypothetical protein